MNTATDKVYDFLIGTFSSIFVIGRKSKYTIYDCKFNAPITIPAHMYRYFAMFCL